VNDDERNALGGGFWEDLDSLLCDVSQLFDGWHTDVAWTEWDASVRKRVTEVRQRLAVSDAGPWGRDECLRRMRRTLRAWLNRDNADYEDDEDKELDSDDEDLLAALCVDARAVYATPRAACE
jgi:hypothetical protein